MDIFNSMLVSMPVADVASAFWDSTFPGKVIVLILFGGSALAWTIMWTKGVQLKFAPKVSLISYGPVLAQGTKGRSIKITGQARLNR